MNFAELHKEITKDNVQELAQRCSEHWKSFLMQHAAELGRGQTSWPAHRILVQLAMECAEDSPQTSPRSAAVAGSRRL